MRWLFLLLLVINLGVFLWGYQRDMNMARVLPVPKPGVGNLRLWSEVQPPAIAEAEPEVAEPVEQEPAPVAEEAVPEPELMVEEEPVAEEPEVTEIEPWPQMVEMTMLTPEEEAESGGVTACFRLGFLELRDVADVISEQLAGAGIEATIQDELVQIEAGFWVVIPPLPTSDEALQKVRDLKAAGIRDVWRFTGGEKKNAISLGLFSSRENADRAKRRAEDRGFHPEVQARFRDKQRYWLEFSSIKKLPLSNDLLQQLEADYPGLELSAQDCP